MLSRKRASSAVRLPRVFSCSMASRSMLCCASGNSGWSRFWPVVGSGASPRWTMALEPKESTSALKSSFGAFDSSAMESPQIEGVLLQAIAALDEQHGLPALARLRDGFLELAQRVDFGAVHREHQVASAQAGARRLRAALDLVHGQHRLLHVVAGLAGVAHRQLRHRKSAPRLEDSQRALRSQRRGLA